MIFMRRSFLCSSSLRRYFCSIDTGNYIYMDYKIKGQNFEFLIPNAVSEEEVRKETVLISEDEPISTLIQKLNDNGVDFNPQKFVLTQNLELHRETRLKDALSSPLYMVDTLNNLTVRFKNRTPQEINPLNDFIRKSFEEIKIPFQYQKLTYEYLKRIESSYLARTKSSLFPTSEHEKSELDKDNLLASIIDSIPTHKGRGFENEEKTFIRYKEVLLRIQNNEDLIEEMNIKAKSLAKQKIFLGLFLILGQFSYVAYGTYHIFSWDIVEPTVYFMNLGAAIVFYSLYFRMRKKFEYNNFYDYLVKKELEKINRNFKMNILEETERLKKEKQDLKNSLNNYFLNLL